MNLYTILPAIIMIAGGFISSLNQFVGAMLCIFGLIALIAFIAIGLYRNNRIGFYRFIKIIGISSALIVIFTTVSLFLQ